MRGSGESLGSRNSEWSLEERSDALEVLEWILGQKWCDGKIGLFGFSYDGTAAEFLSLGNHKSIKAIVSYFSVFDIYSDIAFPGGIHFSWFTKNWYKINNALDNLNLSRYFGNWIDLIIRG
ncbi:MAG: CocE/NonD family hydrolase, partial [Spirochaetia bacterium]|nr:CocE/NonD family hydrolase [Spirochaetia bacterium]